MYFMRVSQREAEYEKQFAKTAPAPTTPGEGGGTTSPKSSTAFNILKAIGGISAIYGILSIANDIFPKIMSAYEQIKNFDIKKWTEETFTDEFFTSIIDNIIDIYRQLKDGFMKFVNNIDSETIGNFMVGLANNFIEIMKFIGETIMRGLSTLSSEE